MVFNLLKPKLIMNKLLVNCFKVKPYRYKYRQRLISVFKKVKTLINEEFYKKNYILLSLF